ncbi:hypothetical protein E2C01_073987 [Portunus trituberculatus]|uniref:Uncharacterized protein n=1 Tax=Portunus trituberculatus TaxID=210409 RepID=A0A5B7IC53_PORTR|nr:hypothetical protein [Portunus trituberculatus]
MNPFIVLPLATCLVVLVVTGTTAVATHRHSLGIYTVTPTSLLPNLPRFPRQTVKESGIGKARKKMKKQLKRLKGLGCKPKWTKVSVKEYIGKDDALLDKNRLLPEVVVVKRCIKSCSYCGNSLGSEHQECYPENKRNKTVIITYTDDVHNYYKIRIPEHKSCRCK